MVWVGVSCQVVFTAAPWGAWALVIAAAPLTARAAVAVLGLLYETYSDGASDVCQLSVYVTDGAGLRIIWRSTASLAMLGGCRPRPTGRCARSRARPGVLRARRGGGWWAVVASLR